MVLALNMSSFNVSNKKSMFSYDPTRKALPFEVEVEVKFNNIALTVDDWKKGHKLVIIWQA